MKLYHYGVRGTALDWLKSYLHNRSQFVQFDNITSTNENITIGVPQGSILGPLLFLLYINDIAKISSVLMPILFADDSNVFVSGESVEDITNLVNIEKDKIVLWLKVKKLSLNVKKSKFMVFHNRHVKILSEGNAAIFIEGTKVDRVYSHNFLGFIIDPTLKRDSHVKATSIRRLLKAQGLSVKLASTSIKRRY